MSEKAETKPPEWWTVRYPRLWPLLNSSVGLWFLSSVVIGGLGTWYTKNQNDQAELLKKLELAQVDESKKRELIEKLDLEIGFRLSTSLLQLEELAQNIKRCNSKTGNNPMCKAVEISIESIFLTRSPKPTMFPEFAPYSTLALVADLKRLAPVSEHEKLKQVIYDMSGMHAMLRVGKVSLDNPKAVAGKILSKLVLSRWKQGFYNLDCNEQAPFCYA